MGDGARLGAWLGGKEWPQGGGQRGQAHWPCASSASCAVRNSIFITCTSTKHNNNVTRFFARFYHQPFLLFGKHCPDIPLFSAACPRIMSSLDNCFIDQVTEPLHLIEVDQQQPARCSAHLQLSTAQELAAHFDQNRDYSCRLMLAAS
jgi:hypothetical protein